MKYKTSILSCVLFLVGCGATISNKQDACANVNDCHTHHMEYTVFGYDGAYFELTNITKESHLTEKEKVIYSKIYNAFLYYKDTPFLYGGEDLDGIDCSSFVMHIYNDAFNIKLHRTTGQMRKDGRYKNINSIENLKVGDLLFFFDDDSHVAIYMGNGKMIHSNSYFGVIEHKFDGHYKEAFSLAKRIIK